MRWYAMPPELRNWNFGLGGGWVYDLYCVLGFVVQGERKWPCLTEQNLEGFLLDSNFVSENAQRCRPVDLLYKKGRQCNWPVVQYNLLKTKKNYCHLKKQPVCIDTHDLQTTLHDNWTTLHKTSPSRQSEICIMFERTMRLYPKNGL